MSEETNVVDEEKESGGDSAGYARYDHGLCSVS
jgi:hypothetical protein